MLSLSSHPSPLTSTLPDKAGLTLGSFGEQKLSLLCQGLGVSRLLGKEFLRVFRILGRSWADWPLGSAPGWPTDITDDGSPFEFSVAFDGRTPKIRVLVESQRDPMTLASSWEAGLRLNELLSQSQRVDLERFDRVRDLFAPAQEMQARFTLWHAAVLEERLSTAYKVYLNPQVHGSHASQSVVLKALARLDMRGASEFLVSRSVLYKHDQFVYFSLDLSADPGARVKVYVAHPGADADEIERALEGTGNHVPGEAKQWIHDLLGNHGPFDDRPILTCYAFTSSSDPPLATVHLPVRSYTKNDEDSVERARKYLSVEDGRAFRSAAGLFARRPLSAGRSLVTYVSLRRSERGPQVTAYLAPEVFAVVSPRVPGPDKQTGASA
jgi:DMATS type aromatic prenyltransferase